MDAIRERLGLLATPGLPADDDAALAETVRLRARFLAKSPRSDPRS